MSFVKILFLSFATIFTLLSDLLPAYTCATRTIYPHILLTLDDFELVSICASFGPETAVGHQVLLQRISCTSLWAIFSLVFSFSPSLVTPFTSLPSSSASATLLHGLGSASCLLNCCCSSCRLYSVATLGCLAPIMSSIFRLAFFMFSSC